MSNSSIQPISSPLEQLLNVVSSPKATISSPVWEHKKQPNKKLSNYFSIESPPVSEKSEWHQLSDWKALLKIEELLNNEKNIFQFYTLDKTLKCKVAKIKVGHLKNDVLTEEEKGKIQNNEKIKKLKRWVASVAIAHEGFFTQLFSFIIHGLLGYGWISTAGKASRIFGRMQQYEAEKWQKKYMDGWMIEKRQFMPFSEEPFRSRLYRVTAKDLADKGFKKEVVKLEDFGKGIGYVNGIINPFDYAHQTAEHIAKIARAEVRGVYNATFGLIADLTEAFFGFWGVNTRPVRKIAQMVDDFFDNQTNPNARFLLIGHSQGAVHVTRFLEWYHKECPERCKQIDVLLFCAGANPEPALCSHYGSLKSFRVNHLRDPATWFDRKVFHALPKGYAKVLPSHPEAPYFDHPLISKTYYRKLKKHIRRFVKKPIEAPSAA